MQLSPGREYERYIASLFHPNEFYVERGVNHFREQVLEVDGLFTDCRDVSMPRIVVECKTGVGFFRHLFKMGGQLSYLRFPRGYFFHQDAEKNAFVVEEVAKHFGISAFDDALGEHFQEKLITGRIIRRRDDNFSSSWVDFYRLED